MAFSRILWGDLCGHDAVTERLLEPVQKRDEPRRWPVPDGLPISPLAKGLDIDI